jgi:hypothetical protein
VSSFFLLDEFCSEALRAQAQLPAWNPKKKGTPEGVPCKVEFAFPD